MPPSAIWKVLSAVRNELLSTIRLVRFWLVMLLLSSAMFTAYILSCLVYVNIAPFNISFVGGTPKYLLGNLDPTYFLFFQAGILLLVFDQRQRLQRNRMLEVIESRPVSNLQYQLGNTLCYSGLMWAVIFVNVLLMQCIGLTSQLFQFDTADTLQLRSMFNLLVVDTPVALLFWTSLFLLLSHVLRSRLLVLSTSLFLMLAYYLWVLNTPFSFVDLLSHSSNQTLFISDILPALPSTTSWIMRAGALLLVVALVTIGAWLYRRSNSTHRVWTQALPLTSLLLSGLVMTTGVLYELFKTNEMRNWREAHLTSEWNTELDIQTIQGAVEINPRKHLHIDLILGFKLTSESAVQSLVFTLNPGYRVSSIHLNETQCKFEFKQGILEISVPFSVEPETTYSLKVQATGKPNPRFAYINAPYDYLKDANFPIQAIHSFGTDGSVYNSKFVALMPGVYWYPVPGSIPRAADDVSFRKDFFDVELQIRLDAPTSWTVVGPGISSPIPNERPNYWIKPNIPIASIGLFASEYVEIAYEFESIRLALYIHLRHSKKFSHLERYQQRVIEKLDKYFNDLEAQEVPVPYSSLAVIEVPNVLRTVGGGWRMDRLNSLPGVVLMKERGLPTLNLNRLVREDDGTDADRRDKFNRTWSALRLADERALGNESLLLGVQDQIWKHHIFITGPHHRALDLILQVWSARFTSMFNSRLFSVYASAQTSRMTGVNFPSALGIDRGRSASLYRKDTLYWKELRLGARPEIWNLLERSALSKLKFNLENHREEFEVLLLKSRLIAESIDDFQRHSGRNSNFNLWLTKLRRKFVAQPLTFEDMASLALDFDIEFEHFLADWLAKDTLAGFELEQGVSTQIADSEDGKPRFLFSFDIRNSQSAAGYVFVPAYLPSNPLIVLEGNTSRHVTILLDRGLDFGAGLNLPLYTGLSLNRGPLGLFIRTKNVSVDESLVPQAVVKESNFVPKQIGIVVDDLDDGFVVHQPSPIPMRFRLVPRDWFRLSVFEQIFDGVLPDIGEEIRIHHATWVRRTEQNAYGKYRRTVALSSVPGSLKVHPVRFIADIPESGRWSLDFYLHLPSNFMQYGSIENFNLKIENGSRHWNEEFYPDPLVLGWKTVGEYKLDRGRTDVVIVGTTKPSVVYADAIRWRKKTDLE